MASCLTEGGDGPVAARETRRRIGSAIVSEERDSDPETGHAYLPPAPEEGPSLRTKLLRALAVVVAVVVVLVLKNTVFDERTPAAGAGGGPVLVIPGAGTPSGA
jgi:hypothetical protein